MLDSMVYNLTSGVFCYAERSIKQAACAGTQKAGQETMTEERLSNGETARQAEIMTARYKNSGRCGCRRITLNCIAKSFSGTAGQSNNA